MDDRYTSEPSPRVSSSFRIAARFHPGYSLLGRLIRFFAADRWQAGSLYLALVMLGGTLLLLAHLFAWNLAPEALTHTPTWFGAETALALLLAVASLIGWQPAIVIVCDDAGLHLSQGRRQFTVAPDDVASIRTVAARRYHRRERRYAGTRVFVNRVPEEVLLVRAAEAVVAIGLAEPERTTLRRRLEARCLEDAGLPALSE